MSTTPRPSPRIYITMSPRDHERLAKLKDRLGVASASETIRQALRALERELDARVQGKRKR